MSRRVLWGLFCKGANPIHEGSSLLTYHLPKAPPPNTITLNIQHMNLGGGRGTQTFCHHQEGWVGELRPACGEPSPAHGVCLGRLLPLSVQGERQQRASRDHSQLLTNTRWTCCWAFSPQWTPGRNSTWGHLPAHPVPCEAAPVSLWPRAFGQGSQACVWIWRTFKHLSLCWPWT